VVLQLQTKGFANCRGAPQVLGIGACRLAKANLDLCFPVSLANAVCVDVTIAADGDNFTNYMLMN